jgi:hypothetical protein
MFVNLLLNSLSFQFNFSMTADGTGLGSRVPTVKPKLLELKRTSGSQTSLDTASARAGGKSPRGIGRARIASAAG